MISSSEPTAPAGLRLRAYAGEADLEAIVAIMNAENRADGIPERLTVADLRAEYSNPGDHFDPARDVVLAEMDGQPVGVSSGEWIDTHADELREHRLFGAVHPDWRRRGIGSALHRDAERRARELAATQQTERRRMLAMFTGERQAGAVAIAQASGYHAVRWFFDMVRPDLDDIPEIPMPEGLEVRPITEDLHRALWEADLEAFRDHWGGFDDSEESFRRWLASPHFDPALFVVAFDGDEIAGGVLNGIFAEENAELGLRRGWLNSVFTRRAWRKRGLARALIARSLLVLRDRGMTEAALGVDAENPLGALGLYESVGFRTAERFTAWRRPLEDGR
jgi:mycothiol synthase